VKCAHCGHVQEVDPKLLHALADYQSQVQGKLDEADAIRPPPGPPGAVPDASWQVKLIVAVLLAASMSVPLLFRRSELAIYVAVIGVVVAVVVAIVMSGRKRAARSMLTQPVSARCPICGGVNRLAPGAPLGRCTFCGAGLAPDRQAREKVVAEAEQIRRDARFASYAVIHGKILSRYEYLVVHDARYAMLFMLVIALSLAAVPTMILVPELRGVLAFFLALSAGLGVFKWTRANARRRFTKALEALAHDAGGTMEAGPGQTVSWLRRWWDAPTPGLPADGELVSASVAFVHDGCPVLLDAAPASAPCAVILAACRPPAVGEDQAPGPPPPSAAAQRDACGALGFDLRVTSAGLWLELNAVYAGDLTDPALRRIRSVLPLVTQAARAMGVRPSQPFGESVASPSS
jgi:hypothetical protein